MAHTNPAAKGEQATDALPAARTARKLLCYYGDDFTGSTDVLEALFRTGLRTVLFLEPPDASMLGQERFAAMDAFGVAGVGRSLTPEEAERTLRPIFATLKSSGAAIVHYKICSTFDSSPGIGNIGTAAAIGRETFGEGYIPLVVGVPYLGRYTVFGHHFARAGEAVHRLDRHPTMSRHPITPMKESDLRVHLSEQCDDRISLLDLTEQDAELPVVRERLERRVAEEKPDLLLFDVLDEQRLERVGQLLWQEAQSREGMFVIGSSGIEYALGAAWQALRLPELQPDRAAVARAYPVDRLLVVSGSCSPVTEEQIGEAMKLGFTGIRVPVDELIDPERAKQARNLLLTEATERLERGESVILFSASGPDDPGIAEFRRGLLAQGFRAEDSSKLLGGLLGELVRSVIELTGLKRLVVAGGDTSGYVTRELGIFALECVSVLAPGAPLCRASSASPQLDGLELILKGGQVGERDFFQRAKNGG
jgi:uncharacterized protein YgbK (DUF1537 family)